MFERIHSEREKANIAMKHCKTKHENRFNFTKVQTQIQKGFETIRHRS